ncbi:sulfate adenylyltransferase subunit CysN, partial [Escherichia coli]|nr:sulfate adenylyltransferase subunit CysN [Escherichia coli]
SLGLNEIALTSVSLTDKVAVDTYSALPQTGAFIIIDRYTNVTVGAGMVHALNDGQDNVRHYTQAEKELNAYVRKHYPEW